MYHTNIFLLKRENVFKTKTDRHHYRSRNRTWYETLYTKFVFYGWGGGNGSYLRYQLRILLRNVRGN